MTGRNINEHVHEWAAPRRADLWAEFRERMSGTDTRGWLYDTLRQDRPADLGYWIGYEIAKAYYKRAEDKRKGIGDMSSGLTAEEFLERSGYPGEFGAAAPSGGTDPPFTTQSAHIHLALTRSPNLALLATCARFTGAVNVRCTIEPRP